MLLVFSLSVTLYICILFDFKLDYNKNIQIAILVSELNHAFAKKKQSWDGYNRDKIV